MRAARAIPGGWSADALVQGGIMLALLAVVVGAGFFPRTVRSEARQPVLRADVMSLPGLGGAADAAPPAANDEDPFVITRVIGAARPVTDDAASDVVVGTGAGATDAQSGEDAGADERAEEVRPIRYAYEIVEGDTVIGIATRFGIDADYIVWNNVDTLPNADLLRPGQTLQIPSVEGIIHDVRLHETLTEIAELYDADIADIIAFPANELSDPDQLREGSTILVPGGRIVAPLVVWTPPAAPPPATPVPSDDDAAEPEPTPAGTTSTHGFIWPGWGDITSYFGPSHPLGIDIGMPVGSPIVATAPGQVTFVGGHPCCSYGYYVSIKHDETFASRYGHLSRFNVSLGEWVEQGDVIAWSGSTGLSTGPHLHFEIRRKGVVQNPMLYLP